MDVMASQITSFSIFYSTVYTGADQRKHQSSASLAFVWAVNSPHKWPITRKRFLFDDVIMDCILIAKNISISITTKYPHSSGMGMSSEFCKTYIVTKPKSSKYIKTLSYKPVKYQASAICCTSIHTIMPWYFHYLFESKCTGMFVVINSQCMATRSKRDDVSFSWHF